MASLAELRDALTALNVSTSTGALRGEARRAALQQRLDEARHQLGLQTPYGTTTTSSTTHEEYVQVQQSPSTTLQPGDVQRLSLSELRAALEARGLSTQTPGLKGDTRRHTLIQRLLNATATAGSSSVQTRERAQQAPSREDGSGSSRTARVDSEDKINSARSSSSSYSAAGEFFFFDLPSAKESTALQPEVPTLLLSPQHRPRTLREHHSAPPASTSSVVFADDDSEDTAAKIRRELEHELIELRKELHTRRAKYSRDIEVLIATTGFTQSLDELSASMETLEQERRRLVRSWFAHELVTSSVLSPKTAHPLELVQADAVRLIDARQQHLRQQIERTKAALAIARKDIGEDPQHNHAERELVLAIQRIQTQLQLYPKTHGSSSARSTASSESSTLSDHSVSTSNNYSASPTSATPVLTRCRTLPARHFLETWRDLDAGQRQQLHHELRAAASFRIRRGRVCVGGNGNADSSVSARSTMPAMTPHGRQSILTFTRYPPTAADKLGIKALFLEQSGRSAVEVNRVYQQALALEPQHAIVLGNYARFLHTVCGQVDQARSYYERAVCADPLCVANLVAVARFWHRTRQDLARAEEIYLQALAVAPQDVQLLGDYASLLRQRAGHAKHATSQLVQAKQLLEQAQSLSPSHIGNRLHLAAVYNDLGDIKRAMHCYNALARDVDALLPMEDGGNQIETVHDQPSPRTVRVMAEYAPVYGNFANFLRRHGHFDRAKRMYVLALRLLPRDLLLQRNFSTFLRDHKASLTPTPRDPRSAPSATGGHKHNVPHQEAIDSCARTVAQ